MKKLKLFLSLTLFVLISASSEAQNITIIESESYNPGHIMDQVWQSVATGMGMTATIDPQSTLYDTAFFSTTDALIVSSGVITLTSSQITTINEFMASGKSLYLQGEYDCSAYNTNSTFESMVNDNGGNFTLNGTVAGILAPMDVLGTLGTTPNVVSPLTYFWYGCNGTACSYVEPFLEYGSQYFGFIFCPPANNYGRVVFTTDQDWINQSISLPLMQNILTLLTSGTYQCSGSNYFGLSLGSDTTLCPGSSLILNAGSSSFTYLWSTGSTDTSITVTAAGTYWLTVNNGSCVVSDTILITDSLCSPLAFAANDTEVCQKFCVDFFDSSQNNPTAWQWYFPGGNPPSSTNKNPVNICYDDSGTYDVTLITTSAAGNDTLTLPNYITVYATPPFPSIVQNGYVLTASAGAAYQWQLNSADIPGATDQSYTVLQTGLYTVIVYDQHGCKNTASQYVQIVGISEINEGSNFIVLPNPNGGSFVIESSCNSGETVSVRIENSIGELIFHSEEQSPGISFRKEIYLGDIADGVYVVEISAANQQGRQKIVVSR
ncbi:MAG: T9SS type A sorting domain-containing protein [Chitinophagales bacterium]